MAFKKLTSPQCFFVEINFKEQPTAPWFNLVYWTLWCIFYVWSNSICFSGYVVLIGNIVIIMREQHELEGLVVKTRKRIIRRNLFFSLFFLSNCFQYWFISFRSRCLVEAWQPRAHLFGDDTQQQVLPPHNAQHTIHTTRRLKICNTQKHLPETLFFVCLPLASADIYTDA